MRTSRIPRRLGAALVLAASLAALSACSSSNTPTDPSSASATTSATPAAALHIAGAVTLTLTVSDASCTAQQSGAAGWEISGQAVSSSSGQTEPWSLTEYPNTSPAELRLELPDGSQYDSDADATGAASGLSVSASSISLSAVPLYTNGDASAAEVTVTGTATCAK